MVAFDCFAQSTELMPKVQGPTNYPPVVGQARIPFDYAQEPTNYTKKTNYNKGRITRIKTNYTKNANYTN